ncbi:MAG: NAD kinase, partial [Bacteroidota bacterium]
MQVAIYSRGLDTEQGAHLGFLLEALTRYEVKILIYQPLLTQFSDVMGRYGNLVPFLLSEDLPLDLDCLISLGGDGTLLDTVSLVRDKKIPILGVNFGRLGFLAGISRDELSTAVEALVNRTYIIDKRTLIHLDADKPLFGETPFGLNEFAIHKRDTSPMIKVHAYINGEFLNTYWADGLIVSTATGSTGYNMSCNGPILFPESSSFVITPVAAHNLNIRSVVVPDTNIISFEIESRAELFICALDARREIVDKNIQLAVRKEQFGLHLIRLSENTFLSTLRT